MNDWIFDSIVNALNDARSSIDLRSHIFTCLVIIGVALEILFLWVDHQGDFKAWVVARTHFKIPWPERPSRAKFFAEAFSVGLVVLGIWGEFHEGGRSARLETLARQVDGLRNTLLQREAGSAASSAEHAASAASRAQASADAANDDLKQVESRVAKLKGEVMPMEPRQKLLADAEPLFVKNLSSFGHQKQEFGIFACPPVGAGGKLGYEEIMNRESEEILRTASGITRILAGKKMDWIPVSLGPHGTRVASLSEQCGDFWVKGVTVAVSSAAPKSTRDAAAALQSTLSRVLPGNFNELRVVDPETIRLDKTYPMQLIREIPNAITIVVVRPQQPQ